MSGWKSHRHWTDPNCNFPHLPLIIIFTAQIRIRMDLRLTYFHRGTGTRSSWLLLGCQQRAWTRQSLYYWAPGLVQNVLAVLLNAKASNTHAHSLSVTIKDNTGSQNHNRGQMLKLRKVFWKEGSWFASSKIISFREFLSFLNNFAISDTEKGFEPFKSV